MKVSISTDPEVNPWNPMTSPIDLKYLGKLVEECNELGSSIARCIIQGIDESEPVTGKVNRTWLQEEIADVLANIELIQDHFCMNREFINTRAARKMVQLRKWHNMLVGEPK